MPHNARDAFHMLPLYHTKPFAATDNCTYKEKAKYKEALHDVRAHIIDARSPRSECSVHRPTGNIAVYYGIRPGEEIVSQIAQMHTMISVSLSRLIFAFKIFNHVRNLEKGKYLI